MTAEERYDIECQIDALYNEADYCDDHNNPSRAVAARHEANELRKKLDATEEDFSEDYSDEDPFDVDWDADGQDDLQEDALITEDTYSRFNKYKPYYKQRLDAVKKGKIAFIDVSGSNYPPREDSVEKFQTPDFEDVFYFAGFVDRDAHTAARQGNTDYREIVKYAKANPDKSIYVYTDDDLFWNPGGDKLQKLANVQIYDIRTGHLLKLKESLEGVCTFRVNFNKKPDDFKEFGSEDEAIKFAKDNLSDEPHVFKKCGDGDPEEIASYQDWEYGVREDYTGNPEERTDHLDYVDDNPTDGKFKFPKNITKKEDDHCNVNPVVNCDPDDKKVLKESVNMNNYNFYRMDQEINSWEAWVMVEVSDKNNPNKPVIFTIGGPAASDIGDYFDVDVSGSWSKYDNRDVGLGNNWEFDCDGATVDLPKGDKYILGCFDCDFSVYDPATKDLKDITAADVCGILGISNTDLDDLVDEVKNRALETFSDHYSAYVYDNPDDFVEEPDPDDYGSNDDGDF